MIFYLYSSGAPVVDGWEEWDLCVSKVLKDDAASGALVMQDHVPMEINATSMTDHESLTFPSNPVHDGQLSASDAGSTTEEMVINDVAELIDGFQGDQGRLIIQLQLMLSKLAKEKGSDSKDFVNDATAAVVNPMVLVKEKRSWSLPFFPKQNRWLGESINGAALTREFIQESGLLRKYYLDFSLNGEEDSVPTTLELFMNAVRNANEINGKCLSVQNMQMLYMSESLISGSSVADVANIWGQRFVDYYPMMHCTTVRDSNDLDDVTPKNSEEDESDFDRDEQSQDGDIDDTSSVSSTTDPEAIPIIHEEISNQEYDLEDSDQDETSPNFLAKVAKKVGRAAGVMGNALEGAVGIFGDWVIMQLADGSTSKVFVEKEEKR